MRRRLTASDAAGVPAEATVTLRFGCFDDAPDLLRARARQLEGTERRRWRRGWRRGVLRTLVGGFS